MLSFIKNFGVSFQPNCWEEEDTRVDNPGRGFYRIYTYYPGTVPYEPPVRYEGECLALVLMDIVAFRDRELDFSALNEMRSILSAFRDLGFQMIVRICYDTEGKGMVREPSLFSLVKKHFSQVISVLKEFEEDIYVYQGLLVGNWGEMHESKFLSPKCLQELITLFRQETDGRIPLSIRKPVQLRCAFSENALSQGAGGKIGFFNDGILGSQTHLGTFGPETAGKCGWGEMWGTEEEILFMKPFVDEVPYGGEVLFPTEPLKPEQVVKILSKLRVSYLNSTHEERMLTEWKKTSYEGKTLYEYVEEHLGYLLRVRSVGMKLGKRWDCTVEVFNDGFGVLYEEAEVLLWMRQEGQTPILLGRMEGTLRGITGGESRMLRLAFDRPSCSEKSQHYRLEFLLSIRRMCDQKQIFFAQKSEEAGILLGTVFRGR